MYRLLFLSIMLVFASGCVTTGKYRIKSDEALKYRGEAQGLNDKLAGLTSDYYKLSADRENLERENESLTKRLENLQNDNKTLSGALLATKNEKDKMISDLTSQMAAINTDREALKEQIAAQAREKEKEISELKGTYDNLVENLKTEIKTGEITITQLKGRLTVNMVDKILFDSGESAVNKQGRHALDTVGNVLKTVNNKQIRIEGHTDNVPIGRELMSKYPSNWELSTARATNVAKYLIEKAGIDSRLIGVSGYADTRPLDTNATEEGKSHNRRIEIILLPPDDTPAAK